MRKHSVWKLGREERGVMQPSVMFVDFVHISLFFGGKAIQTKLTVTFLPLSTRRTSGASAGVRYLPGMSPIFHVSIPQDPNGLSFRDEIDYPLI